MYALPTLSIKASIAPSSTMLTVHPPKPAPVIREPITPSTFHASSTSASSSGPVTS